MSDLPAMMATLCSYDRLFGPRHVQTLALTARIALVLRERGESGTALSLLERVVRDLGQSAGRTHAARISALQALRDLLTELSDSARAASVQAELVECWRILAGAGAPETASARTDLEFMLMSRIKSCERRKSE